MPRPKVAREGLAEGALEIVILFLLIAGSCAICVSPVCAQDGGGAQSTSSSLRKMLTLSPAIPGTAEYELQQKVAHAEGLLGELDAISSARVSFSPRSDGSSRSDEVGGLRVIVRLQLAGEDGWSQQLCDTIIGLLQHVEPQLAREDVLIIDVRGRTLFQMGRNMMAVAAVEGSQAGRTSPTLSRGIVIGIGALLGLSAVLWWCLVAGRRVGAAVKESGGVGGRWAFLSEVEPARLQAVLDTARPELIGAIAAQLDERGAARLRRTVGAAQSESVVPERAMDPDVEAALLSRIRDMLGRID